MSLCKNRFSSRSKLRQKALEGQVESLKEEVQALRTEAEDKQKIVDRLSEVSDVIVWTCNASSPTSKPKALDAPSRRSKLTIRTSNLNNLAG